MPEENKKLYKASMKGTGTVPKVRQRYNNNSDDHFTSNVLSNNLGREHDRSFGSDSNRQYRNLQFNPFFTSTTMDGSSEGGSSRQNSVINLANGVTSPSTSHSSQQNSGFNMKCDNVTKYPDKKQIENKLSQIREYLQVVSSLRANMKNTDEQLQNSMLLHSDNDDVRDDSDQLSEMIRDLSDSEAKLVSILNEMNEPVQNSECELDEAASNEKHVDAVVENMQKLKEQESLLLQLQLSAESQLREARAAQAKLEKASTRNIIERERFGGSEGALNGRNYDVGRTTVRHEQVQNQIELLEGHMNPIREGNDNRNHLVEVLDHRNAQLQAENVTLQGKLLDLQTKKRQIEEFAMQLQNMNEDEEEDVGTKVKRIVNMKEHLDKLKDMLRIVQTTENSIETQNVIDDEIEEHINRLCLKTDNIMIHNRVPPPRRQENNSSMSSSTNERHVKEKQVNKKSMNVNERERMIYIQAELRAKKKELEELMSKHNAATSNLNQDVQHDNKSDAGACGVNPVLENTLNAWYPVDANLFHLPQSSEQYSSDEAAEDDTNEYSEINSSSELNGHPIVSMPPMNYPTSNYVKRLPEAEVNVEMPGDSYLNVASRAPRSPTRSIRSVTPAYRPSGDQVDNSRSQLQKQLELIKSVCDSMLDSASTSTNGGQANIQVRNNLTPSPIYSDPRHYGSPRPNNGNALNILSNNDANVQTNPAQFSPSDSASYQNWLTTNALQTQGFILNTLNQCCQMLWLQQKELANLRNSVATLQERYPNNGNANCDPHGNGLYMNACPFSPNCNAAAAAAAAATLNAPPAAVGNHFRHHPHSTKMNHASAGAAASSNPLAGPYGTTNMEHVCVTHCNLPNGRILDNGLNNSSVHHPQNMIGEHVSNLPWNGQALNNQVPPGNRANNYWDNFRSYSRQNLLSSKSNEGLQNTSCFLNHRSNNSSERSQPSSTASQTGPKLNTNNNEAISSATSVENTPKRVKIIRRRCNSSGGGLHQAEPMVHQNTTASSKNNDNSLSLDFHADVASNSFPSAYAVSSASATAVDSDSSVLDGPRHFKESDGGLRRNRNEWTDEDVAAGGGNSVAEKSKLFEELRENVYKEVASLISANQGRPHFLIQLFRDLQFVSSDPLRRRTLQSIQAVITNSLSNPSNPAGARRQDANNCVLNEEDRASSDIFPSANGFPELPSNIWPLLPRQSDSDELMDAAAASVQEQSPELVTFLNSHDEDIFSDSLVHSLRDTLMHSTFAAVFANGPAKDGMIQKHFASLLTEALEQFRGQKVQDVRHNVVKTVENLQRGEISLIRLMRENISENNDCVLPDSPAGVFAAGIGLPRMDEFDVPQMPNGDLAEADQSCLDVEEAEEGAVGGVIGILNAAAVPQVLVDDAGLSNVVECDSTEISEQGLDQVPTRLTNPSSRSNTPNKSL